jgi:hypothetical protein
MAVAVNWDQDTKHCCRADCGRVRAPATADGVQPLECQWHIDRFQERVLRLVHDHPRGKPRKPPAAVRFQPPPPLAVEDVCPRCHAGPAADHQITGC